MKYLFFDDSHVERIENLARKLHQPRHFPNNVVLRPEHHEASVTAACIAAHLGSESIMPEERNEYRLRKRL